LKKKIDLLLREWVMNDQPDYNELLAHTKRLEARVAFLEETLNQYQSEGTRVKTRFLANISHDIRTPMNAIIGFSHLLGEDEVDGNRRESYINHITRNSNSLLNMMDNLIDLTLIETGSLELKEEEVDIYQIMKELYDYYNSERYRVNKDRIALLLNVREAFKKAKIISDKQRLSRTICCLLENALTLTEKGVVEFGASFADKNSLVIFIKDSSSMLHQERARKIFEKSDKKEEDWYNTSDTIGLGYKLARGLVEAMGGEITVRDSPFNGNAIEFSIPVRMVIPKHYRSGVTESILSLLKKEEQM
jgi:K+-sensing histidine kinase KdpD